MNFLLSRDKNLWMTAHMMIKPRCATLGRGNDQEIRGKANPIGLGVPDASPIGRPERVQITCECTDRLKQRLAVATVLLDTLKQIDVMRLHAFQFLSKEEYDCKFRKGRDCTRRPSEESWQLR